MFTPILPNKEVTWWGCKTVPSVSAQPLIEVLIWRNLLFLQEKVPADGYRHPIPIDLCWLWMTISFTIPVSVGIPWVNLPDIAYSFSRVDEWNEFVSYGNAFMRAWKKWTLMVKKDNQWDVIVSFVANDVWMQWNNEINLESITSVVVKNSKEWE